MVQTLLFIVVKHIHISLIGGSVLLIEQSLTLCEKCWHNYMQECFFIENMAGAECIVIIVLPKKKD